MKLVIYDHTGQQQWQSDVFVEGKDFEWTSPRPQAFWLGTIKLISEERFNEEHGIRPIHPLPEQYQTFKDELVTEQEAKELQENITEKEAKEVQGIEPETVDNQSAGDSRAGETSPSENIEELSQEDNRGETTQRDKKPRKRKAT